LAADSFIQCRVSAADSLSCCRSAAACSASFVAVAKIGEKNRFVDAELAQWRSVALSTNHDDAVTTN
jgi:hypothetical protein